ncbi:uncharacterized protein RAG0_02109 [Rhynchosporium agropyri]|uniref:Dihydroneopterin aldolase/epimerase domain-containing protein n=1 Tax=Rhynchosporium agropyri TaxID=914238 RepID=A0A1E1K069_9HELO|nr:uncharacterized protein RAG0_02109 [Rhynchosporium agropyri]
MASTNSSASAQENVGEMRLLLTPHALSNLTGDPHTSISITNLQAVLPLGIDAWGRPNITQPVLISTHISLRNPFTTASSTDTVVSGSTVHYGTLSKAILKACVAFERVCKAGDGEERREMSLRALVEFLHFYLTGSRDTVPVSQSQVALFIEKDTDGKVLEPLLKNVEMQLFELEVTLPKASLMGSGISLKGSFGYASGKEGPTAYSMVLKLKDLRIPTLVGVNPNERLAKQMVVVNVEILRWDVVGDEYCALEELVAKSTEESSFQTLEALALHLIERIIQYVILPLASSKASDISDKPQLDNYPLIRIYLSKPTAVTFADAPTVSMVVDSDPGNSEVAREVWGRNAGKGAIRRVPFPLVGRLEEWIEKQGNDRESSDT